MAERIILRTEVYPLATLVMSECDMGPCGKTFDIQYVEPDGTVIEYSYEDLEDLEKDWIMFQEYAKPPVPKGKRGPKCKIQFILLPIKGTTKYMQLAVDFRK